VDYPTKYVRHIVTYLTAVGACLFVAMMLLVVANVICRALGYAILGTHEAAGIMMAITVAFALAYCALTQNHVVVTIVINRLRQPVRTVLAVITTIISLGTWALLAWKSAEFAREQWLVGEATHIMEWTLYPFRYVFVFGVILLCLVLLTDLFKLLKGSVSK
jgi:TRAP-type C4-dicarboxylate transport system permease small subunit